jgi:hypothetical protein
MSSPNKFTTDIYKDRLLDNLGHFIQTNMNEMGKREIGGIVINTYYTLELPNIPHSAYPILILRRTSESYKRDVDIKTINLNLKYGMDYRNVEKYLGIVPWLSERMWETLSLWTTGGGNLQGEYIVYDMTSRYYTNEVTLRTSFDQNRNPYEFIWESNMTLRV